MPFALQVLKQSIGINEEFDFGMRISCYNFFPGEIQMSVPHFILKKEMLRHFFLEAHINTTLKSLGFIVRVKLMSLQNLPKGCFQI